MNKQIDGIIRLTRFKEFLCFVVITTLLGAIAGDGKFGWPLISILVGNWLAVGFAFMINDVEDAPDDALTPYKAVRNPVSARILSSNAARIASFGVALLALCVFATLGLVPFLLGGFSVVLGFLYSWRLVRFKTLPFLDMASHCLMLAGMQFLSAYFTFSPSFNGKWAFPFVCVMCISLYGELFNELRDLEGDIKAGLTHTAVLLGPRITHIIMLALGMIGIIAGIISIVVVGLIPIWVLLLLAVLAVILVTPQLLKIKQGKSSIQLQEPLQKPIEIATAFALLVQFLVPWANAFIPLSSIWAYINFLAR